MTEYNNQNDQQQKPSNSYWIYGLIFLALFLFARKCSCNDESIHTEKPRTELVTDSEKVPYWVIGEWQCQSPFGLMRLKITSSAITEFMPDERPISSSYHMQGSTLMTDGSSGTYYDLDMANHRISAGRGYYFYKVK